MSDQVLSWLLILGGLAVLVGGGELLLRGAVAIAAAMRISPLLIGLTVVAFGTSAPELGVSLQAAFSGAADVAVGNVIGSNILNVLFVLGIATLIAPLVVSRQLVLYDVPVMIAISFLVWWMASDGVIGRVDGMALCVILVIYIVTCIRRSRSSSAADKAESADQDPPTLKTGMFLAGQAGLVVVGLVLLGLGSRWLVSGAVSVATWFGVSELLIGLTVVAAGTSMPEVVTSVMAGLRGEREIAIGNVVGSNILNLAFVLGVSSVITPGGMSVNAEAIGFDFPVMCCVAVACFPIFLTGEGIRRWEGMLFLVGFVIYTVVRIWF